MNGLDYFLAVVLVAAAAHGLFLGAVSQVISFGGLWGGLAVAVVLAPHTRALGHDPTTRIILVVATLVLVPAVAIAAARTVGVHVWRAVQRARLGLVDKLGGAVIAVVAALLAAWMVAGVVGRLPNPSVSAEIETSTILRAVDRTMPAPPAVFSRIGRLLDPLGFPDVFAQFEPNAPAPLPLPADPVVRAAVARVGASVVKVEGGACGQVQEGSGFAVAPGMVVTNAHVVAGVQRPVVIDRVSSHRAATILFDPALDVAVLQVPGLDVPPLTFASAPAGRGTEGVIMGYPGGGPFAAGPAVVLSRVDAMGRDIYGRSLITRAVYYLNGVVRPGNSGGPLVRADGTVVGVVFARSVADPNIAYALTSDEVARRVATAVAGAAPVGTGSCAA